MVSWVDSVLNNVRVTKKKDLISVTGIRSCKLLFREMERVFGTSRFKNGMFDNITSTSFTVSNFFLYDFYEMVQKLHSNGTRYYRKDIVDKLLTELNNLPEIARTKKVFASKLDYSQLLRFPVKPLPAQSEFFNFYDQKTQQYGLNGYILAASPGSGKTYMSTMLQAMLNKDMTFVFSPTNALEEVWRRTINTIKDAKVWVYPDKLDLDMKYTHYVFNHDNTKYAKRVITDILAKRPMSNIGVILDECHKFTELVAAQTNNIVDICRMTRSNDIIFMSGTPFKALGREMLPFLMATDPLFTQKDMDGFKKIFGASGSSANSILAARIGRVMYKIAKEQVVKNDVTTYEVKVKIPNGQDYTLPVLKEKMRKFIHWRYEYFQKEGHKYIAEYQRILDQFRATLNNKRDIEAFERYVKLARLVRNSKNLMLVKEEIKETNVYEKNVIIPTLNSDDKVTFREVKSIYKYVSLKIQGEALGQVLGAERIRCNLDIVKYIDNGTIYSDKADLINEAWGLEDIFMTSKTKVVMFTDFVQVLEETMNILNKRGYHPVAVYGSTNKDLNSNIEKFKNDPSINPIIATYKSLSTAVPLVMSDTVVLLNVPFRDYIYQQTTSRVDRLGQDHPVHIYQYQLDTGDVPNISTRSKEIMEWSKKMVEELMGVESEQLDDEDEIVDDAIEKYSKSNKTKALFSTW